MVRLLSIQCLMDAAHQYSPPAQKTATGHIYTSAHSYVFMLYTDRHAHSYMDVYTHMQHTHTP